MVSGHIYVMYILLQLKKMDTVGKAQTDTKCRQTLGFQSTRLLRDRGPEMDADCTWPCTPSRSRRCQEWLWLNQRTSTSNDLMNKYILMCLLSKIWSCILLHPKMQNAPSSELQGPKPPHWGGPAHWGRGLTLLQLPGVGRSALVTESPLADGFHMTRQLRNTDLSAMRTFYESKHPGGRQGHM